MGVRERSALVQAACWSAIVVVVTLLSLRGWGTLQPGIYQDDAFYLVLARSIAFGDSYGLINEPGPPAPAKYPFGFPLVLSPVVRLFPHQLEAATIVSLVATLITIALLYWGWPLLSSTTSRWWALGTVSLFAMSPWVVGQTREVLSEPTFTALVVLALLLTEACVHRRGPSYGLAAALGVVVMGAFFTRWIGISVVIAVFALIVLARKPFADRVRSLATIFVAGLAALALVLVFTSVDLRQLTPERHLSELRSPPVRRKSGVRLEPGLAVIAEYASDELRRVVVPSGGGSRERALGERLGIRNLSTIIGVSVTTLLAFGAWQSMRTRALAPTVLLFELVYFGALCCWPSVTIRLLFPLLPFLILQLLLAVDALNRAAERLWPGARRLRTWAVVAVWGGLLLVSTAKSWVLGDSRRSTGDLGVGTTWLAAHSPPEAIVMSQHPQITYLYAERKTMKLPPVHTTAELERALQDGQVDYLLLRPELEWRPNGAHTYDAHTQQVVLPALSELTSQGKTAIVYESTPEEMVRVYQVKR